MMDAPFRSREISPFAWPRARPRGAVGTGARMLTLGLLATIIQACTSVPPLAGSAEPALLQYSDQRRAEREARAAVPLEDRIAAIETDLADSVVSVGEGALAPRYLYHDDSKGPVHLETNAAILSALAAKYAVTGDDEARALGERIVQGLVGLDALSGELDGFVPRYASADDLEPTDQTTHANAYTQLLFAYVMADAHFGPSAEIERHVSLIYHKFAEHDFAMPHVDGSYVQRADLDRTFMAFNARRTLDRRLLDEAAHQLGDEATRALVEAHRWDRPLLGPLHVRVFALELPTPSSSWLNLQAMTALNELGGTYQDRVVWLAEQYERDDNPFFRTLAGLSGGEVDLAGIRSRLAEHPYPATSSGIINSHREEVILAPPLYIKFEANPESIEPLPLYEVRSSTYLWKRKLREIDSQPETRPRQLLGHDLHQAYWFFRLLEQTR